MQVQNVLLLIVGIALTVAVAVAGWFGYIYSYGRYCPFDDYGEYWGG